MALERRPVESGKLSDVYVHIGSSSTPRATQGSCPILLRDLRESGARGGERCLDLGIAVSGRHEARFVSRWGEINAALEHRVKEAFETFAIALHDFGETARRRVAEIDAEHAAYRLRRERDTRFPCLRSEAFHESLGFAFQIFLKLFGLHDFE